MLSPHTGLRPASTSATTVLARRVCERLFQLCAPNETYPCSSGGVTETRNTSTVRPSGRSSSMSLKFNENRFGRYVARPSSIAGRAKSPINSSNSRRKVSSWPARYQPGSVNGAATRRSIATPFSVQWRKSAPGSTRGPAIGIITKSPAFTSFIASSAEASRRLYSSGQSMSVAAHYAKRGSVCQVTKPRQGWTRIPCRDKMLSAIRPERGPDARPHSARDRRATRQAGDVPAQAPPLVADQVQHQRVLPQCRECPLESSGTPSDRRSHSADRNRDDRGRFMIGGSSDLIRWVIIVGFILFIAGFVLSLRRQSRPQEKIWRGTPMDPKGPRVGQRLLS